MGDRRGKKRLVAAVLAAALVFARAAGMANAKLIQRGNLFIRFKGDIYQGNTVFPEQATFPTQGHILAFNAAYGGEEAILAHVYGTEPVPITRILVFRIRRRRGTFGTVLPPSCRNRSTTMAT